MEDNMSAATKEATVSRMTQAIVEQDKDALAGIFTGDMVFHLRGPYDLAGDHDGVDGLLDVLGSVFAATNGDVRLDQQFCVGTTGWAAEFEHAVLGRNGRTLHSDNAFVYRFDGDRIAEMWMFLGASPDDAAEFFA
jgi:ketosteroid isomerase-like protein